MREKLPLIVNMLIRDLDQGTLFRIVYISWNTSMAWVCRIDDNSLPFPMDTNELLAKLDPIHGSFNIELDDPWSQPRLTIERQTATALRNEKHFALIEPLITGENEGLIVSSKFRAKLIETRLNEVKCTRQTIYKLLLRFWKRGMTCEAIRPDYVNCGGRGQRRNSTDKKIGAPRTITPGTGININDEIRPILRIGADYWLSPKKPSYQEALDRIIGLFFSKRITEGKEVIAYEIEQDKKPTVRQLQYFIKSEYPYGHMRRKRDGQKMWNLNNRELLGMADGDVQGPGDRFQVDATVADVYLVSQFDRRRIVGRPIIYFVIDVYSRLIVGVYVGFEGPSWIGAMMALVNMVTPKVEFCKKYGININAEDWPSHYACRRLMADCGELKSVKLGENINKQLLIDIENASPGRADLKSLVERRFGIVPAKFRQFTPGYVKQDFGERGAKDYRLEAALNLYEFTQMVILAIWEHNFTPIRNIHLPAAMITEGYSPTPLDFWNWGIMNRSGFLRVLTIDQVALNVMPHETARVTAKGIKFKSGFYSCHTAVADEWFAKARHNEWSVDVSFDPRDLGILYIRDPQLPNGYEPCKLLDHCLELLGKSLYETEEKELAQKINTASGENTELSKRVFIDARMEDIEKNAKKATKAVVDTNIPKTQLVAGIRNNRSEEKEIQREAEKFNLAGTSESPTSLDSASSPNISEVSASRPSNDLTLLKNLRMNREGNKDGQAA